MLGRVLFALVWLIITAGLVLPMYPPDVATPRPPAAATAPLVADTTTSGCETDAQVLASPSAAPEACVCLTVHLVVRPLPSAPSFTPQPAPPKLPAI
jgi:hypothetical protein